jgi:hypothetical protein
MISVMCGVALVASAGCSSGGRRTVTIGFGSQVSVEVSSNGRTLTFAVPTCHGKPTTRVVESDSQVRLLVTSDTSSSDKCADMSTVTLDKPLGTRTVVDDKTGKPIATRRSAA